MSFMGVEAGVNDLHVKCLTFHAGGQSLCPFNRPANNVPQFINCHHDRSCKEHNLGVVTESSNIDDLVW